MVGWVKLPMYCSFHTIISHSKRQPRNSESDHGNRKSHLKPRTLPGTENQDDRSEMVLVGWLMKGQAPLLQMNMGRAALTNQTTGISTVP